MIFYPFSIFSLIVLGPIYLIGTALLIGIAKLLRKKGYQGWKALLALGLLFYVGPIAEELWIAANYAYRCYSDAGLVIYKSVEVDGFYDDSEGWRADRLLSSPYRWVEGRSSTGAGDTYWRHERVRASKME
ncbi:MAG TPA: hypothetical protein VFA81_00590 [Burkholderiales bacterium]|nr:hypothetical protein [Burkholderiales bacterium]